MDDEVVSVDLDSGFGLFLGLVRGDRVWGSSDAYGVSVE